MCKKMSMKTSPQKGYPKPPSPPGLLVLVLIGKLRNKSLF